MSVDYAGPLVREAECTGKFRFDNPQLARKAAQRRVAREAYRCRACGGWHVGNLRPRRFRPRKPTSGGE